MCGICGSWDFKDDATESVVQSLVTSLEHRGPDSSGLKNFPKSKFAMGHTRLAIIDPFGPSQPMTSSTGRFTIVFNGEIYNYEELRKGLTYNFKTAGDTETILALWESEAELCLKKLRGQFAFAIFDEELEQITFVTDAFGILPLYVYDGDEGLIFSSTASSISKVLGTFKPDLNSIPQLLTTRAVVAPQTPYLDIRRLPPGAIWKYGKLGKTERKWAQDWSEIRPSPTDDNSHLELVKLLNTAAERAIVSDVKVGVFLSGGLDSAIIAKLAQSNLSYPMNSYTAVWPNNESDSELKEASRTAELLGLKSHIVEISAEKWWSAFEDAAQYRDAPLSEPADAVIFALSAEAKKDVKVVLTGEGADELFGGYKKNRIETLTQVPGFIELSKFLLASGVANRSEKLERLFFSCSTQEKYLRWNRYFANHWNFEFTELPTHTYDKFLEDSLRGMRLFDLENWLPNLLLDRADRLAMAHGLEMRPLFLDIDVANFALKLPSRDLYSWRRSKPLLRQAALGILPNELISRKKLGFPIPISDWFANSLSENVEAVLSQESLIMDQYVSRTERLKLFALHKSGKRLSPMKIFTLVSIMKWLDQ